MATRTIALSPSAGFVRSMAPLTLGHFVTDLSQGALPALLPLLAARFHLSYGAVGAIVLCSTVASSIVQPAFGHWSDRRGAAWLLVAGPLVAGVGVALLGVAPSYPVVLACVLLSGIGVAGYHPEATKFASWASGDRRSSGMSIFSVGGNAGVAVGPLLATGLGLAYAGALALPGVLGALAILLFLPRLRALTSVGAARAAEAGADDWGATLLLLLGVAVRGYVHFGLLTFVPLFEERVRGASASRGAALLTLMLGAGALGTLAMGPIADRFGRREALTWSLALCVPATALYVSEPGALGALGLAVTGACIVSTFGVTIVLSHEYLPSRMGMAAGLSIGLSIGLGGIAALGLGALADQVGLQAALWTVPIAAAVGMLCASLLPRRQARLRQ